MLLFQVLATQTSATARRSDVAGLVSWFGSEAFAAWFETRSEANALRALRDLRRGVSEAVASFEVITTTQAFAVGAPKKWRIQNLSF